MIREYWMKNAFDTWPILSFWLVMVWLRLNKVTDYTHFNSDNHVFHPLSTTLAFKYNFTAPAFLTTLKF